MTLSLIFVKLLPFHVTADWLIYCGKFKLNKINNCQIWNPHRIWSTTKKWHEIFWTYRTQMKSKWQRCGPYCRYQVSTLFFLLCGWNQIWGLSKYCPCAATFSKLDLKHLSLSSRCLTLEGYATTIKDISIKFTSLIDLGLVSLTKSGFRSKIDETCLPMGLLEYWDTMQNCSCGKLCFWSSNVRALQWSTQILGELLKLL